MALSLGETVVVLLAWKSKGKKQKFDHQKLLEIFLAKELKDQLVKEE